jgi:fatty-acyl-CoA synthase
MTASYFHRGGTEPLLGATIPEHFQVVAERFSERDAIVSVPQSRRLSYRQLAGEVDRLARGLLAIGFGKGDRIGVWSTNNIEWLLVQMATARIGAVLVNINPAYRPRELAYALQRSEVQGLFVIPRFRSSDYVAMLAGLIPELKQTVSGDLNSTEFPSLRRVVLYDPSDPDATEAPHAGFMVWKQVIAAAASVDNERLDQLTSSLDRDDAINIQYTSGTTGFPKAVLLSHHNILNNAWFSARAMNFSEQDRLAVPVPFYHYPPCSSHNWNTRVLPSLT